jgi:hypothetical protein
MFTYSIKTCLFICLPKYVHQEGERERNGAHSRANGSDACWRDRLLLGGRTAGEIAPSLTRRRKAAHSAGASPVWVLHFSRMSCGREQSGVCAWSSVYPSAIDSCSTSPTRCCCVNRNSQVNTLCLSSGYQFHVLPFVWLLYVTFFGVLQ